MLVSQQHTPGTGGLGDSGGLMDSQLILVIDDSPTIRKMVECHLSQAGYRVVLASDAERGLELARTISPSLILLDHQLPGTTGDQVCRELLQREETARIPVVISSAMRNKAFAQYTDFPNIVDQIPKPFTSEMLKSGVANALQMGALVVQAQQSGSAVPEAVGEGNESVLEGNTDSFPVRTVLDFLNNGQQRGRLTLELGQDRIRFIVGSGRVQAVISPTITAERIASSLAPDLADLSPLLTLTLGEHQDASMAGLVKLLERSLSDPSRLRALLRHQAAVLTHAALTGKPGRFSFDPGTMMPPMFQAFPLQLSLPALAVEGVRACEPAGDLDRWRGMVYGRQNPRGGNLDRTGMSPAEIRVHTLLDGLLDLATVALRGNLGLGDVVSVIRGLEMTGLVEHKSAMAQSLILLLEEDSRTVSLIQSVLGPEGDGFPIKHVHDRVAVQLLLRRNPSALVLMAIDRGEQETLFRALKEHAPPTTRFVGIRHLDDEGELVRLDALGLDGILQRPLLESDLRATVKHLLTAGQMAGVS
jgi:CheY-like chemotaxis protein